MRAAMRRASIDAGKSSQEENAKAAAAAATAAAAALEAPSVELPEAVGGQVRVVSSGRRNSVDTGDPAQDSMRAAMRRASLGGGAESGPPQQALDDPRPTPEEEKPASPTPEVPDASSAGGLREGAVDEVLSFTGLTPESSPDLPPRAVPARVGDLGPVGAGGGFGLASSGGSGDERSPSPASHGADEIGEIEAFGGSIQESPALRPQVQRRPATAPAPAATQHVADASADDLDLDIEEIS